jgi:hypothetical protein
MKWELPAWCWAGLAGLAGLDQLEMKGALPAGLQSAPAACIYHRIDRNPSPSYEPQMRRDTYAFSLDPLTLIPDVINNLRITL